MAGIYKKNIYDVLEKSSNVPGKPSINSIY